MTVNNFLFRLMHILDCVPGAETGSQLPVLDQNLSFTIISKNEKGQPRIVTLQFTSRDERNLVFNKIRALLTAALLKETDFASTNSKLISSHSAANNKSFSTFRIPTIKAFLNNPPLENSTRGNTAKVCLFSKDLIFFWLI